MMVTGSFRRNNYRSPTDYRENVRRFNTDKFPIIQVLITKPLIIPLFPTMIIQITLWPNFRFSEHCSLDGWWFDENSPWGSAEFRWREALGYSTC